MPEFIQCDDGLVSQTNNGLFLRCRFSDGAVLLSEQQVIDLYAAPDTIDDATAAGISLTLFVVAVASYGARKALDVFDIE